LKREVASLEEQLLAKAKTAGDAPPRANELLTQIGALARETVSEVDPEP
jgi:signal transduction histidine kinase